MRYNQSGGHAVHTEPPQGGDVAPLRPRTTTPPLRQHVSHLTPTTSRSYATAEVALWPGTAFVGRNGRGKTNLVRRSTASRPRVPPRRQRRPAGPGRSESVVRAAVVRDGRTAVLEVGELNPAGRTAPGQLVPAFPVPARLPVGLVRTVVFSPGDPRWSRGDPGRPAEVPRRPVCPAGTAAGRRAPTTTGRVRAQLLAAQDRGSRTPRQLVAGVGPVDARGVGRPPGADRRRAPRRAARAGRRAAALRRQGVRDRGRGATRDDADIRVPAVLRRRRPGPKRARTSPRRCSPRSNGGGVTSSIVGLAVGPHRDELLLTLGHGAGPDDDPTLPGQGATPPTGSPGPSRSRCGWRRTTCSVPTATTRS